MTQLVLDRRGRVVGVVGQFDFLQNAQQNVQQAGQQAFQAAQVPAWEQLGNLQGSQQSNQFGNPINSSNPTVVEEVSPEGEDIVHADPIQEPALPQWNPNMPGQANIMPTMSPAELERMQQAGRAARARRLAEQQAARKPWTRTTKAAATGLATGAIAGVAAAVVAPANKMGWGLGMGLLGLLIGGGVSYAMSPADEG